MLFPSQNILETSTFHHIFTSFHSGWGVQYYKWKPSDKPSPSDLAKYQYFHARTLLSFLPFEEKLALFIANVFWNIYFLPHIHCLWEWVRFVILQINADFLINQLSKYFYTRRLTTLPYFLISKKKKKIYIYIYIYIARDLIPFFHCAKTWRSPSKTVFERSTFYQIFTSFQSGERVLYFK